MGEAKRRAQVALAEAEEKAKLPKVALAYLHSDGNRSTSFEDSLLFLRMFDAAHQDLLSERYAVRCGTGELVASRNMVAAKLIDSTCDWVLIIDTDMGFEPDALSKLLSVAHPMDRPIVGGLCFAYRHYAADGLNGWRARPQPTIYTWQDTDNGESGFQAVYMYPVNGLMRVAATGSAMILIHRSVFEKIAERFGPTWYDRTPAPDGTLLGEDISFCVKATLCEIPIHVHTGVRTSHFKQTWVSDMDHWRAYNPPPATQRTAVIVPTRGRPRNAEPFMTSLRASTGLATAYAICDDDEPESVEAWRAAGAEVIVDNVITFAKKVNVGYAKTSEPWLFLVGDDVRFHPGWLDHAQHVGEVLEASVVGTNDLGNERVMKGEHATHLLVRRSYVEETGASWDGAGVVCHEGYRHNFVDDEVVRAAKLRGVWQMALGSVVEHLHPIFKKADGDATYDLGEAAYDTDKALFESRLAANHPATMAVAQ